MTTLRLRHVFAAALAVCLLALGATDAHATHFRYGTIRWEEIPVSPPDPNQVRIKVTAESAWRFTFAWPGGATPTLGVPLDTGQDVVVQRTANNSPVGQPAALMVTPSSINVMENWFVGSTLLEFQFARNLLPVRIFWDGTARVSNLQDGNNDQSFRVESVMSATPNAAAPVASILPIITVGYPSSNEGARFFIPAADVEGDPLTWSITQPLSRSRLVKATPDGALNLFPTLSINPTSGEVTWRTDLELNPVLDGSHYYAVQFLVTDSKGAETPVDALLRLINTVPNPPVATINGSQNPHIVAVRPNNPVTFTLVGTDNDPGATVTLTSGNLPPGATMTPSLPTGGTSPRSSVFNWTPTLAQAGNSYTISFAVTDEFANQDTISASITVLVNFPPVPTCPAPVTAEATGPLGASNVTINADVFDEDPEPLTVRWFVDGVLVETDTVPAGPGPTQGQVSLTRSYAFLPSPHAIRVEVSDALATRECTSTVTVVDTTGPVVTVPSTTWEATSPAGAVATFVATAVDVVDGNVTPVICVPPSGSTFALGVTTVTCTATDSRGNPGSGTGTVTVVDTSGPVVTVPSTTWEATSPAGAVATFVATAVDVVDGNVTPVICVPPSGSTFALGVTTVTCTATDSRGNPGSGTGTVTVVDTSGPVVTVPSTTWEATSPAGAVATFVATAVDAVDGNVTPVTCVPPSGSTFALGVTTVTCTATDSRGNPGSGTGTVTVVDTSGPVVTVPSTTWEATSPAGAVATFVATAVDAVDGNVTPVTCVPPSGSTFPLGVTPVTCTATDSRGNPGSGTGTVTVVDTRGPVVTVPSTIWEATSPAGAVATFVATAVDVVDGNVTPVTCVPPSGSTFALGVTPVNCTATDSHGNTGSGTGTVTVRDTIPPVITNNPGNQVREATGPAGAAVTWPPLIATDIADPSVPVICSPASGSTFAITPPAPIATVTCTATDDSGNNAIPATFTVRVQDTTPPVITGFGNITVPGTGGGAFVPWPPPTAVDLVDGVRPVTCVPASGSFFPIGTTTVTCTASDTRGNTRTITFTVTVVNGDTKPPKVCLTLKPGTLWPPNHKMRTIEVILKVTDNQDPTPSCAITSVTSSEPVTGPKYGNTTPDWTFNGLHLQLRAERYSKHGRTYTVTVRCMDDAGNTTTTTGTVRVPHDQGHGLLDGDDSKHGGGGNQSGKCCLKPRPHGDDDDDDDGHFWTNETDNTTGGGENKDPKPCPNPDIDDDDDHDDDDGHVTLTPDASGTK